jgi:hypothetical protein
LDGEFDAIDAAFDEATGHVHDGTANNGAPITKVGPAQDLVVSTGAVTPKTDNAVDLGTNSFEFKDLYIDGVANIDSLVADTADIDGGSIDGVTIGTNSVVTDLRVDNLRLDGNTISSTDTNGNIVLAPNGTGDVVPGTDDTYDLGSSSAEWKDLFIDGTANIDSLVADTADINAGTIDNTVIGGSTAAAGTFTTATATTGNITNVNATTVDTTNIEVTNIKAKDGTAAGSIADSTGVVTLASTVLTTTDINGGTVDGVTIGGASAGAGTFTTATATTGNITNVNATTVDTTNIEVTNIKAKDGTASATIADSTGVMTVASSVLTTTDINGGTIDGTAIGGASAAAGAFTTLSASGVTTVQAGTVSAPAITTTGDTNTGIFFPAADTIAFAEGGAEAMRIDSSGNVLVGATTAISNEKVLIQKDINDNNNVGLLVKNASSGTSAGATINLGNDVNNGPAIKLASSTNTTFGNSAFVLYNNLASPMTFWTNNAERMRIDSSGNVGIGTSSPAVTLSVVSSDQVVGNFAHSSISTVDNNGGAVLRIQNTSNTNGNMESLLFANSNASGTSGIFGYNTNQSTNEGFMTFGTRNSSGTFAERARITSGGDFFIGGTYGAGLQVFYNNTDGVNSRSGQGAGNVRSLFTGWYSATSTTSGTLSFNVTTNGNVTNSNNSYGQISDIKTKQDVIDAASQWDDIKNIRVRKFRFKNDPTGPLQIGVVAQEAELVSPGLINEHPDRKEEIRTREVEKTREVEITPAVLDEDGNVVEPAVMETETYTEEEEYTETVDLGTTTKSVKYSILYMKAVKALQEAMERIETLEAKVSALEGN